MNLAPWLGPAAVVLISWGIVGLLQKVSTNHLSAESAMLWNVAGYFILLPWLIPGKPILSYPHRSLLWALLCALFNAIGAWALLAAMASGGKASIVVPVTALYPIVVVLTGPVILHESITLWTGCGVGCALAAVMLLSA